MSKQPNYVFDDELYHHGIQGQRWGFRRFQNEDGSWTPEGRERYGEGGAQSKADVQKYKAKVSYNTQKYKANLRSKSQKERDIRSAKEERLRIKENAKTTRLARKEQGKFDRLNKKEEAKLDNQGRPGTFGRTKNLSDSDLQKAIDRLKLQAEYNKQYVLATQPNSALAKADRFFEGPTGKFVRDLAVQTLPTVTNTAVTKLLESNLKYSNKLDKEKMEADIEKTKADAAKVNAEAAEKNAKANDAYQTAHQAAVNARAAQMFGNKNSANTSSNNSAASAPKQIVQASNQVPKAPKQTVQASNQTPKQTQQAPKQAPKVSTTSASAVVNQNKAIPVSTKWTYDHMKLNGMVNETTTRVGISELNKKFIKKKVQYI